MSAAERRRGISKLGGFMPALLATTALLGGGTGLASTAFAQSTVQSADAEDSVEVSPDADGVISLDQVVVTATGFEQNVRDAPASITVVSREELEKGRFRDLTDALREVQGVAVTGVANEKDIYIRGLPGAYTLILVDGKRQSTRDARTNGNAGFEQSFIPPSAPSSGSRSSAVRCRRSTDRTRWAASSTSSPVRSRTTGPAR